MTPLTLGQKRYYMASLCRIVHDAGSKILERVPGSSITDTHDYRGHESSTIDADAREAVLTELERRLPEFDGFVRFELNPIARSPLETGERHEPFTVIFDEIDGTTNAKRAFASSLPCRPQSLVSAALSTSDHLSDLVASAVFTLDSGEVFSAVRAEDDAFLSFCNQRLIAPEDIAVTRGDSRTRILVIGYSNSHRTRKGALEQALYDQRMKVYEGCRASGMDIIGIMRNTSDAYVDLRAFWSTKDARGKEQEAMLQVYDVAGVLPVAAGCGLIVTDGFGNPWQNYGSQDSLSLIVARPGIHSKIIETIQPLIAEWKQASGS